MNIVRTTYITTSISSNIPTILCVTNGKSCGTFKRQVFHNPIVDADRR